jgi:hypothetical protein
MWPLRWTVQPNCLTFLIKYVLPGVTLTCTLASIHWTLILKNLSSTHLLPFGEQFFFFLPRKINPDSLKIKCRYKDTYSTFVCPYKNINCFTFSVHWYIARLFGAQQQIGKYPNRCGFFKFSLNYIHCVHLTLQISQEDKRLCWEFLQRACPCKVSLPKCMVF